MKSIFWNEVKKDNYVVYSPLELWVKIPVWMFNHSTFFSDFSKKYLSIPAVFNFFSTFHR